MNGNDVLDLLKMWAGFIDEDRDLAAKYYEWMLNDKHYTLSHHTALTRRYTTQACVRELLDVWNRTQGVNQ